MPHTIRTERLLMRPPSLRDARAYSRVLNDWDVVAPTGTWTYPLDFRYASFRLRAALTMRPLRDHVFVVEQHGDFVGVCGIHQDKDDVFSIGYMFGRSTWGQGVATEALRAVCEFGFRTCRASMIWGDAFAENPASGRVMQKVGMRFVRQEMGWSAARAASFPTNRFEMTRTEFHP